MKSDYNQNLFGTNGISGTNGKHKMPIVPQVPQMPNDNRKFSSDEHRFVLERYKGINTRYQCPGCKEDKTFVRYIDNKTKEHVHPSVGRCNRESNCGYHYTPKQYFQDNHISNEKDQSWGYNKPASTINKPKPISYIPAELLKASLNNFDNNHFVRFLITLFGTEITSQLITRYFIATSKHWDDATVFWYIDLLGNITYGKIMLFNIIPSNESYIGIDCKRDKKRNDHCASVLQKKLVKEYKPMPQWLKEYQDGDRKINCLFGEHLLRDKTKPVAIVESEKTAIIASVYLPQFIWLAAGSISYLNADKCRVLAGRNVVLFPDLNGFEKWSAKSREFSTIAHFTVSDLLERKATEVERDQGLDLADYLIRFDYREFTEKDPDQLAYSHSEEPEIVQPAITISNTTTTKQSFDFSPEGIADLEQYFKEAILPNDPIRLNPCTTIRDSVLFIQTTLCWLKNHPGNAAYKPYYDQLLEFKHYLESRLN